MSWNKLEDRASKGPWSLLWILLVAVVVLSGIGYAFGWFGEAAKVAQDQYGPKALLEKYEWFKNAAAQLDKKRADIQVFEGRFAHMEKVYGDTPRPKWEREDKEQYNLWSNEVAGLKASYNGLAADYNAQMSKFNWRFANKGDLPAGTTEVLPREFAAYQTK
jgi:hypothetical protein